MQFIVLYFQSFIYFIMLVIMGKKIWLVEKIMFYFDFFFGDKFFDCCLYDVCSVYIM